MNEEVGKMKKQSIFSFLFFFIVVCFDLIFTLFFLLSFGRRPTRVRAGYIGTQRDREMSGIGEHDAKFPKNK